MLLPVHQQTQSEMQSSAFANVSTSNTYDVLDVDVEEESAAELPAINAEKKVRCPPIFVYGKSVSDVNSLITLADIRPGEFLLRLSKSCIQITVKNKSHFSSVVQVLKENDVQFFTHGTSDETPIKIVLVGLPVFSIEDLKKELNDNSVTPSEVRLLSATKNKDSALYLLHFPKGSVKLQDLKTVRSLFNVIVQWRFYTRKKNDAVQCFRCQQYGHGMRNCNLEAKCVKCGELHLTEQCKLPKKLSNQADSEKTKSLIRCANCSQNHTANFKGCPTRLKYLQSVELKKKLQKSKLVGPNKRTMLLTKDVNSATNNILSALTLANVSYADATKNERNEPAVEGDLFSVEEFMNLARELFSRLSQCQSKAMQFLALSELTIKYVYNGK